MSESESLYRNTFLGLALEETLNKLYESGEINTEIRDSFFESFEKNAKICISDYSTKVCSISGELDTYQNLEQDWKFWVKKAIIKNEGTPIEIDMLKIVSTRHDEAMAELNNGRPYKKRKIKDF